MTHPIPDAALESDIAILGKKGRGKSYTARGLVERLLDQGRQVVVLDPLSTWWGLKAGPQGYAIPVIGGDHADVPLNDGAGEALGHYLATSDQSAVIDLGKFRKAELVRFATPFLEELYTHNRKPLWLVLEEADVFAPQQPMPETARMLGEVDRIARRGRQFGFKLISLTQRPARLNKDVLTQLSTLVALGLTSPQDRDAIKAWVEGAGDRDKAKAVIDSLAHLKVGEGWVWSPDHDILEHVRFPKIKTPDTSATPKAGEARKVAAVRKDVDVEALRSALTVVDKDAESKTLSGKAKSGQVDTRVPDAAEIAAAEKRGYDRGFDDGEMVGKERGALAGWKAAMTCIQRDLDGFADSIATPQDHEVGEQEIAKALGLAAWPKAPGGAPAPRPVVLARAPVPVAARTNGHAPVLDGGLPPAKRKILDALAWLESIGQNAAPRNVVAFLGGISSKSSAYANNVSALRTAGLVDYPGDGQLALTMTGRSHATKPARRLDHDAMMEALAGKLMPAQMRILRAAVRAHPKPLSRDDLAEGAEASPSSSAFANNVSRLSSLGLVTYPANGAVRAADLLFPAPSPHPLPSASVTGG